MPPKIRGQTYYTYRELADFEAGTRELRVNKLARVAGAANKKHQTETVEFGGMRVKVDGDKRLN